VTNPLRQVKLPTDALPMQGDFSVEGIWKHVVTNASASSFRRSRSDKLHLKEAAAPAWRQK
jgi:hypothetical protein